MKTDKEFVSKPAAFLLLLGFGAVLYFRTLEVPFYFDDMRWIVDNPQLSSLPDIFQARGVSFLSLYLNLKYFGLSLTGFHIVNISLHVATSFLVFLLLNRFKLLSGMPALLGSLFFLVHPVQTQAVNYIVQRMTLLSAMFSLLSCNLYLQFREMSVVSTGRSSKRWGLYLLALSAGWLALQSKQNAAILPLLLVLLEWEREPAEDGPFWRRCQWILPFFLAPLYYAVVELVLPAAALGGGQGIANAEFLQKAELVTPLHYFVTEWKVIFIYLRLLLLPVWQMFDYGYPFVDTLWSFGSVAAGLGIVALLGGAVWALKRLPFVGIGLLWFFVSLSVESTFIPLDPIFEHRLYLPIVGACIIIAGCYRSFLPKRWPFVAVLLLLCGLTLMRNDVWRDPVDLWAQDVAHGSQSYRSYFGYADALYGEGQKDAAARMYETGTDLFLGSNSVDQTNPKFLYNLGVAFERLGKYKRAESFYRGAIENRPNYGVAYYGLGVALYRQGRFPEAERAFNSAMIYQPDKADPINARADTLLRLGKVEEALVLVERLKTLSPRQYRELMDELRQERGTAK